MSPAPSSTEKVQDSETSVHKKEWYLSYRQTKKNSLFLLQPPTLKPLSSKALQVCKTSQNEVLSSLV